MRTGAHGWILINPPDAPLAFELWHVGNIFCPYIDCAGVNRNASANHVQHRGFSRAVTAYHRDKLALLDSQVKILKQAHLVYGSGVVIFAYVV